MARTKKETVKVVGGTGYPKRCWAHVPSDDPSTWYLLMYAGPDDELPDGESVLHCVEAIKRAGFARSQSRLLKGELPFAQGRLIAAWKDALPHLDIPDALTQGAVTVDETSTES